MLIDFSHICDLHIGEKNNILMAGFPELKLEKNIKKLQDSADYLVLHDCDYFPINGLLGKEISPLIGEGKIGERNWDSDIKYWKEFHPLKFLCYTGKVHTGPPTLIASNTHPCEQIEVDFTIKNVDI